MTTTLSDHDSGAIPLGERLDAHRRQNPGKPLLIARKGLAVSGSFQAAITGMLERIPDHPGKPVVVTTLSNAENEFNPFSGLAAPEQDSADGKYLEALVNLLGTGELFEWDTWPAHVTLLSAAAVEALAGTDTNAGNAFDRLQDAGGTVLLSDILYLHDPKADLFHETPLQPHEERRPSAWGKLRYRLDQWLRLEQPCKNPRWKIALEALHSGTKPVTLHITHSWGGGVAQWVESFINADERGINLQLCSEEPESGAGYGQRMSLYLHDQLEAPVAAWWLQPAIRSTASEHSGYQQILREICARFGIGRVVISSLVGHSLDSLSTGLPTIQVLHDFYPQWPLLGIHPEPFLEKGPEQALSAAMQQHPLLPGFSHRNAESWKDLGCQWRHSVSKWGVRLAAPSRSVASLIRKLDPTWTEQDIEIIPHGLPDLPGGLEVIPRDRDDGRLRLVIPGRMQYGKGQRLLLESLPELTEFAQVYLVGAGKDGEAFFGKPGIHVILQYRREQLRDLLATIGPHVAGLLSIVPETFSYTLSEMQQLNIPVIATRVGSLQERIVDGETGWLIDPVPEALLKRVRALAANRTEIMTVREKLADYDLAGTGQMVEKYDTLCPARPARQSVLSLQGPEAAQSAALAFQNSELEEQNRTLAEQAIDLQAEIEKRTAWAEEREKARKDEVERRVRWVNELESRVNDLKNSLEHEQAAHRETNLHLENLRSLHEWVLGTASWRLTRPFRVLNRMVRTLGRARAWNPLRWPLLLSQAVRTISAEGIAGALERSQSARMQQHRPKHFGPVDVEAIGAPEPPAGFPEVSDPLVSIIIPVHNKWAYTAACLRSLAETECQSSFEVIVVDDQSSDETPSRLDQVERLVNLRNRKNLGFVGSCNRGAEVARGRYIVLLNNDTQVLDGWLDALLVTFRNHPDTGMVGAKLVYPDGTLQEAGGLIFRDGSGWNYGKGDDADRPEYGYTREADYCSGACIMLETGLFRELGGFDMRYAPAYYEDTDLAFRIRDKGLKVRIQPAAVIVHHEGITSGTDLSQGAKRYQAVNRKKFLARWQNELSSFPGAIHNPDDRSEIRRARDHRLRGRVLVIDAYTPEPDQDSGSVRLCYLMGCLIDLGYGVTFMADNRAHAGHYTSALQQAGVEVLYDPWIGSLQRFFSERGGEFHFVMISRHYVASNYLNLLRRFCPQAKFIFDTVDLHYLREERMAELEDSLPLKRSAAQTRRSELSVVNSAAATIVVSPVEKEVLEQAAPGARIHVISNIHEVTGSQRPFSERKDIFFVGGFQHPPNIDAARWFVDSIWPLVRKELPEIEFHLIGSKAPEQVRALGGNGVRFHGFVKSLDPWLDGCRLAVAPLRYGAGIKGKVNMSMSRGQPVVATPMAVEGMFVQSGQDVVVAESAEEFAAAVVRLYGDEELWNRVSDAGLENVRQYFSVETARLGLKKLLDSL